MEMSEKFSNLSEQEFNTLKNAIPAITIFIAGADGEIHKEETDWAKKVTEIRSYKMHADLKPFYQEVGKTFQNDLDTLIDELPGDAHAREQILSKRLSAVNSVLSKLDEETATRLYQSYKSFAKHVAKASGGFLGFFSVDTREKDLIELPMIHPFNAELEEE